MKRTNLLAEVFDAQPDRLSNRATTVLLVTRDVLAVLVATVAAFALRFDFRVPSNYAQAILPTALLAAVVFIIVFHRMGLYGYIWRYMGMDSFIRLAVATGAGVVAMGAIVAGTELLLQIRLVPYSILALLGVVGFLGFVGDRSMSRFRVYLRSQRQRADGKRVLIVGAGDAAALLMRDIEDNPDFGYHVVGLLDDDPDKVGRRLRTATVIGTVEQIEEIAERESIDVIFVAVPSADIQALQRILYQCGMAGVTVRVVPALAALRKSVSVSELQSIDLSHLLGREPICADMESVRDSVEGKTVLVTGASGSIGSELCRQVLKLHPSRLVLLELDESRLYETFIELQEIALGTRIEMALADVRNAVKLGRVFDQHRPDLVIHAAAYKHVPLMEMEPDEAVKTNVLGTLNVLNASKDHRAERFLLISTDKAVTPTSVMGLTKAIAERLTFEAACDGLHVTAVRFGNVLGSRGSVVPLFNQRMERGESVQITHPDVDRYFMTIPEAAQLVLQAQSMSSGADLYILDMGEPVRIVDLAAVLIEQRGSDAEICFSGLRPAEKMHEELVHADVQLLPTDCEKVMRSDGLPCAAEGLSELVPHLIEAAEDDDRAEMQRLMLEICPDFAGAVAEMSGVS
jgi:FlaA1/EpsC-like NDP-sugar epimerase